MYVYMTTMHIETLIMHCMKYIHTQIKLEFIETVCLNLNLYRPTKCRYLYFRF
jgi:hypothetical protein